MSTPRVSARHRLPVLGISLILTLPLVLTIAPPARASCPPGFGAPITSGDPHAGPPVILTGLGSAPVASFFLLGSGDQNNSGTLPASAWLVDVGDVDGDGRPDYEVQAPAEGPGGWGDPRTNGCPAFASPAYPPLVLVIYHVREDLDGDGRFDVFEDLNRNGVLDSSPDCPVTGIGCGEDRDRDGHLTPSGTLTTPGGCEGVLREDQDCDGRLDFIDEDPNGNGRVDPGEPGDVDNDGRLERGTEDRNHNQILDDRPFVRVGDHVPIMDSMGNVLSYDDKYPYEEASPSPGGIIVISLAWDGSAYNLQAITTPAEVLGPVEDLDHDGAFDVFEDRNHNGVLDPGEDLDGDGRLTPPGGCEGVTREDKDCDGHLDYIDEDFNHNGVLDPGEDIDNDGRLDDGTEDRNGNQILDDRPFPSPTDQFGYGGSGGLWPTYPYETFLPRPLRLLHASPLDIVIDPRVGPPRPISSLFHVTGAHIDPQGHLRARLDLAGVRLNDDVGGARAIFDRLRLDLPAGGPAQPAVAIAETGVPEIALPSPGDASAGAFLSFLTPWPGAMPTPGPAEARGLSPGSEAFLGAAVPWPGFRLAALLDSDGDHLAQPWDNCPDVANASGEDADGNGIGDACDPGGPGSTAPDAWVPVDASPAPDPGTGSAVAFDAAQGVVVLFGGAGLPDGSTWEYDGLSWRRYAPAVSPEPRAGHRMTYDAARHRVVLYGGLRLSDSGPLGDQWEYDAGAHQWTRVAPSVTPGPRSGFGLAYDSNRDALVLFGGLDGRGAARGDTWVYRAGEWRPVPSPRSPSPRAGALAVFDAFHGVTVLAGGHSPDGADLNDTWEFDGATWQPVDYRGRLVPAAGLTGGFDPARRRTIALGGIPSGAIHLYDGSTWSLLPTRTAIPHLDPEIAAFDVARGVLVARGRPIADPGASGTQELHLSDDADADGVPDAVDDCPRVPDPDQMDADGDGVGDRCDDCPQAFDPAQRDLDRDGIGDACDADRDGDGVPNGADVCPDAYAPGRPYDAVLDGGGADSDSDGVADDCDVCPHDPANDTDGDGLCGDVDNCPLAPNPMQEDSNGDGAGDACQPFVHIVSILPLPRPLGTLDASVTLSDADGDRLAGTLSIFPTLALPEVVSHGLDACGTAFLPDGVAGEGLVYAEVAGAGALLADVDSNFGCVDGIPDFTVAVGSCAATAPGDGMTILPLGGRPLPFPICVRRLNGGAALEFVVQRLGADALVLSGGLASVLSVDYTRSHLPRFLGLGSLSAPGPYVLRVSATDGATPEVHDERLFDWNGQRVLYLNLPRRDTMAAPVLLPTRPLAPVR